MTLLHQPARDHGPSLRDPGIKNRALAHAAKHLGIKEAASRFGIPEEELRVFIVAIGPSEPVTNCKVSA